MMRLTVSPGVTCHVSQVLFQDFSQRVEKCTLPVLAIVLQC